MATRMFAPASTLNLPVTSVAANVNLSPLTGTQARIANVTANEAFILLTTGSTVSVAVPVSTSNSLSGMSIPGNTVMGVDLGGATWISAITSSSVGVSTNLRITMGEGGLT